jgi:hypothetical protein
MVNKTSKKDTAVLKKTVNISAKPAAEAKRPAAPQKSAGAEKSRRTNAVKHEKDIRENGAASQTGASDSVQQPVKSAVLTGANPNVEFYHISEDLPVHLL